MRRWHGRLDDNQREVAAALRAAGCLVLSLADLGYGAPDLLVQAHGRLVLLEIKDGRKPPSARKLTRYEQQFQQLGWRVDVVESVRDALIAVGCTGRSAA